MRLFLLSKTKMEELQMEIRLDERSEKETSVFSASFIDPLQIGIEDKLRFENLFDLPMDMSDAVIVY